MIQTAIDESGNVLWQPLLLPLRAGHPHSTHQTASNPTSNHRSRRRCRRVQREVPHRSKRKTRKRCDVSEGFANRHCCIEQGEVDLTAPALAQSCVQHVTKSSSHCALCRAATRYVTPPRTDTSTLQPATRSASQGRSRCNLSPAPRCCLRSAAPKPGGFGTGRRLRNNSARCSATCSPKTFTCFGSLFTSARYLVCFS